MIIVMKTDATEEQINHVIETLNGLGLGTHLSSGVERTVIGAIGDKKSIQPGMIEMLPGVSEIVPIRKPYKLVSREIHQQDSVIKITNNLSIGGDENTIVMAGPCAIEKESLTVEIAIEIKKAGAHMLRGGAFKPRTSPYSFQGLGEEGLKHMDKARKETGLPIVTEVMDTRDVPIVTKYTDMLQIGARNMQNFNLLKEVGKTKKPVLLKRGPAATIEELLMSAEYIMAEGNKNVILCERGIKTMENYTRNTLDLSAVPAIKYLSHLPVIVDPSHGTGKSYMVKPMALAAVACGADGLMVEVHPKPEEAMSDVPQSLSYKQFNDLMTVMKKVEKAIK